MLFDVPYKLARKWIPQNLYHDILRPLIGRSKTYINTKHYQEIVQRSLSHNINVRDKIVMEIGSGNQYYTALMMLKQAVGRVVLIEPTFASEKHLRQQNFNVAYEQVFNDTQTPASLKEELFKKIDVFPDIKTVPKSWNRNIFFIYSYTVLEHVQNLNELFNQLQRLIHINGKMFHIVDLTDHTYHMFDRYPKLRHLVRSRALFHLRYSKTIFNYLNDPKCYMNRTLWPEYLEVFNASGFEIVNKDLGRADKSFKIHPQLANHNELPKVENILSFEVLLQLKKDT